MYRHIICLFAALACAAPVAAQDRPAAALIITNARVHTVDKNLPAADAIAILRDRIVAVGSNGEIDLWRGAETKVIDARGKLVLPGFNDAHVHFLTGSAQLDRVDLKDAASPEEFARRIAERAKSTAKSEWILGGNWDDQRWNPPQLPTKELIDPVTGEVPVFVDRYDGHMALANSAALRLAGITRLTKAPAGGEIVRDAQGNPTGVLKDAAMGLVYKVVPDMTRTQKLRAVRRGLQHAAELGVTSVQDMGPDAETISLYAELAEGGELTARIYAAPPLAQWRDQAQVGIRRAFGSDLLRMGAVKGFADGSLGSTTAYFFAPYLDAPGTHGLLSDEMTPLSAMRQRMIGADKAGLQLDVHAIGDQAISMVLDLFAEVISTNGKRDRRLRIEHAQHVAPRDFARFARLDVIASVQPYHAIDDGRWAERRIGPERIKTTYAFRRFLDSGVRLALGTDWFVAPLNPMLTLYAAVTRRTLDDKNPNGWVPEQKITLAEAIEAYTLGSAYAEFQQNEKGSITPGKLADIVILSDDLFRMRPEQIQDAQVETTIMGGKVVFSSVPGRR